ncbi:MAG TPA: FtsX-like permease family protein, partial [Ignavibacteriales bacterium]|nr:FtsX-like permease family protein [Ignavibacteriales bacterium]
AIKEISPYKPMQPISTDMDMSIERGDEIIKNGATPFALQMGLEDRFPQIEKSALVFARWGPTFTVDPSKEKSEVKKFKLNTGMAFVQPSFYEIFDFKWIVGDYKSVLSKPRNAAVSKSIAEKYFGVSKGHYSDVIGRRMVMDGYMHITVNGVIEDPPENSDFPFQVVIAQTTHANNNSGLYDNWQKINPRVNTYILLKEGEKPKDFDDRLAAFAKEKYPGNSAVKTSFFLQPLNDLHFNGKMMNYRYRIMDKKVLYVLGLIAAFLILTACVNFINLSAAQAAKRSKEIGIKKTLGAGRAALFSYFMTETSVIVFLAAGISVMLAELFVPVISRGFRMNIEYNSFRDFQAALFLLGLTAATILAAGIYPSALMSKSAPVKAIRGELKGGGVKSGLWLRRSLVTFQFVLSQALIVCVLVISGQIDFIRSKDLGFNKERVLFFDLPDDGVKSKDFIQNSLASVPGVKEASFSLNPPSADGGIWNMAASPENGIDSEIDMEFKPVDENYIKMYGLNLLAGRNLTPTEDPSHIIINETLMKQTGITDPQKALGFSFYRKDPDKRMEVIGVVKDFYSGTLRQEIRPLALASINPPNNELGIIANVKLNEFASAQEMQKALKDIQKIWETSFPSDIYSMHFLDETIDGYYKSEEREANIIRFFTVIAVLIGCIGLYGLISFIAAQKTKEIGVRKVLGASVAGITALLSNEFLVLLGISFTIAWPLSYYYMSKWLERYPERISLGFGIFIPAALIAFVISAATISYRALKAASANPVESLKYE